MITRRALALTIFPIGLVASIAWVAMDSLGGPIHQCTECSPFAQDIVTSLRNNPQDWYEDPYHLANDKLDVEFWIANGIGWFKPSGLRSNPDQWVAGRGGFGASREQRYVWTAYQMWHQKRQIENPLTLENVK